MKQPDIKIQLVHIDGPFKGEINEYLSPVITLGRHPDCDVVFPENLRNISRKHAEIRREGNRFLLLDTSSNGTMVNGKQNAEVFLKNGDVLTLGMGGPKISFLTTILEADPNAGTLEIPAADRPEALFQQPPISQPAPSRPADIPSPPVEKKRLFGDTPVSVPETPKTVQKPLIIQHGASLKVFKSLPVTLGRGQDCDFALDGPSILEHHAQIFFAQGQYWVKDLGGRNLLSVNNQPVQDQTPLLPDMYLSLSPQGPKFHFLGEGRLMEVEAAVPQPSGPQRASRQRQASESPPASGGGRKMLFLLLGGVLLLGICAVALLVVSRTDGGITALREIFSAEQIERVMQFGKGLFGKE